MPTLSLADAEDLIASALRRCATREDNARSVARALVAAEADGQKGHGFSRVPSYAKQAKVGKVDGNAAPSAALPRPGLIAVDAAHGFAFPALDLATEMLPEVTKSQGIAAAAIKRSHHCGVAGHVVEKLAGEGLVSLVFANTPSAIAPAGGSVGIFGTNPIAFGCPLEGRAPIVIDLSLSKVARGGILAAKQRGEKIPEDWALDADGKPTTDPEAALKGTMAPLGGAKGATLALMVELLAAGLTGAQFAAEASSFLDSDGPPPGTGQLIIAVDPRAFGSAARFAVLAGMLEAQDGARLPGVRRYALRDKARRDGIVIADALKAEIQAL
ncbi:(2R)-3-sulfolactate dehydrogenase (NADP(+)) [Variibacter gotjawalensis]|uniref:(2R)-3-sulfolactate dehydrogenase (NADP(+)) n=1 Tax=Variibacter gotjawalensis TaxID=1333996 RepID=A0A0S3PNV1_9BRAD|nr:Ldh family oxidoreductase [Variibacter gotjawalensis]NIK47914.1 (2R)-3-sulfolactate dehydrogenase (NADP+) [Variibacter gotjawalensis]RZS49792.1 (2R)-3-sulfolactate dehydrogenase (NADP+) [Variibacter gotjawalensis]BAT57621.1 (2R)-3-sulfolactate dehydrogenase (NADP(+)) [Variibacter gotjawalensis]